MPAMLASPKERGWSMMDRSEQYIKMADCPEIQEQRPLKTRPMCEDGDIYSSALHKITVYSGVGWEQGYIHPSDLVIWLPRQDDLQAMVELVVTGQTGYPEVSAAVLDKLNNYQWHGFFKSMEQLWLSFVMKEKSSKTWDGDKWQ